MEDVLLGEVKHNPGTTCIFHFPVSVLRMSKTRAENINIPSRNMTLIEISYPIIQILGDSILLGGFKLGYEVFDTFGVDENFVEFICDSAFILYEIHELWVNIMMRYVDLLC